MSQVKAPTLEQVAAAEQLLRDHNAATDARNHAEAKRQAAEEEAARGRLVETVTSLWGLAWEANPNETLSAVTHVAPGIVLYVYPLRDEYACSIRSGDYKEVFYEKAATLPAAVTSLRLGLRTLAGKLAAMATL